jgi:Putative Ig domain
LLGTVDPSAGYNPSTEFWSGLALDSAGKTLYAVNAFGTSNLAQFTLPAGPALQIGPTSAFGFNFQVLGLAFEPSATTATMYGANRTNNNIVEVDPVSGALAFTWGNAFVPGSNRQQITVRPSTHEVWGIHDHSPFSNNAALYTVVSPFPTGTPICELPFGIVETAGGGNDTYGWGGLAFVHDDYNFPWNSCNSVSVHPNKLPHGNATAKLPYSAKFSSTPASAAVLSWSSIPAQPFPGVTLNSSTGDLTGIPTKPGTYTFTVHVTVQLQNGVLCNNGSMTYTVTVI